MRIFDNLIRNFGNYINKINNFQVYNIYYNLLLFKDDFNNLLIINIIII